MNEDDEKLFKTSMSKVKPLRTQSRVKLKKNRGATTTQKTTPDNHYDFLDNEQTQPPYYQQSGVQHKQFRALQRGQLPIEASLDLHRQTKQLARTSVGVFLTDCLQQQKRCVQIIHGKGIRSPDGPVLRKMIKNWLLQVPDVLAFCPSPPTLGGDGATLILLRRVRDCGP